MREFIIPDKQFVQSYTARYLTDEYIFKVLSENNESWSVYRDYERMGLVLRCENKPRDLIVYGLKWVESEMEL